MKFKNKIGISLMLGSMLSTCAGIFVACNNINSNNANVILNSSSTTSSPVDPDSQPVVTLTEQPKTLAEYNATNPKSIATLPKFDARKYNIITSIKNQGSEGLCWAYATAGTAEASILKEELSTDHNIRFAPHNIDYITKTRTASFDPLGNNPQDIWKGPTGVGGAQIWAMNALQMWTGPLDQNIYGDSYMIAPPEYVLENAGVMTIPRTIPVNEKIQKIKEMVAKYGSVTIDFDVPKNNPTYVNTNYLEGRYVGHAVDIIGWDDTINKDLYNNGKYPATLNGGWLCKNSWGPDAGVNGCIYISYDSHIGAMIGLDFDKAHHKYDNNYYYDAKAEDGWAPDKCHGKPNAAIFKAKKANFNTREILNAVNVGVETENTTITAKVYTGVTADFDNPTSDTNNPIGTNLVAEGTKTSQYAGYLTIPLNHEVVLQPNQVFSVVVEATNNKGGLAKLYYSNDISNDNMTFYQQGSSWINIMKESYGGAARIKAFTREEKIPDATSNSLADAKVVLNKDIVRIGEPNPTVVSVRIGDQELTSSDYTVEYGDIVFTMQPNQISKDDDIVGYRKIKVNGTGKYTGTKEIKYYVRVGIAPNLGENGWYTKDAYGNLTVANIRIKDDWRTYNQIVLPSGFNWVGGSSNDVIDKNNPLTLKFSGQYADYYRYTTFDHASGRLVLLGSSAVKPDPDDIDKPTPPNPGPIVPDEGPMDAEHDLTNARIEFKDAEPGNRYKYNGVPVKPKIKVVIPGKPYPVYDSDTYQYNVVVSYKNNNGVGVATVTATAEPGGTYWGSVSAEFTIYSDAVPNPPAPLPPPEPTPTPPPPKPTPIISRVDVSGLNDSYNEGDTINATASVVFNPGPAIPVTYQWTIDGVTVSNTQYLNRSVTYADNNKVIQVTATCANNSLSSSKRIIVNRNTPPAPVPPVITLQRVDINGLQNSYQEGQSIIVTANPVFSDGKVHSGVSYTWRIYNGSTLGYNQTLNTTARYEYNNRYIEVTAYYSGQTVTNKQMITVSKAPAPTPVPPPQPQPQPQPEPLPPSPTPTTPILQSVKIFNLKSSYNEGETISVSAEPKFNTSSIPLGISYYWTINGRNVSGEKNLTTQAKKEYNGTSIQVIVTYGGQTERALSKLTVNSNAVTPTPNQPAESQGMDMKTIIIIAGAGGGFLLLLILISLLIARKRRQSWD